MNKLALALIVTFGVFVFLGAIFIQNSFFKGTLEKLGQSVFTTSPAGSSSYRGNYTAPINNTNHTLNYTAPINNTNLSY